MHEQVLHRLDSHKPSPEIYELARNSNANIAAEFRCGLNSHARRGGMNNSGEQNSRNPLQPLPLLCVNSSFKGGAREVTRARDCCAQAFPRSMNGCFSGSHWFKVCR